MFFFFHPFTDTSTKTRGVANTVSNYSLFIPDSYLKHIFNLFYGGYIVDP